MSIQIRMLLLAGLSILIIFALGVSLTVKLNQAQTLAHNLTHNALEPEAQIASVRDAFKDARLNLNLALSHDEKSALNRFHKDHTMAAHIQKVEQDIEIINREWQAYKRSHLTEREVMIMQQVDPLLVQALETGIKLGVANLKSGNFLEAGKLSLNSVIPAYNQLDQLFPQLSLIQVEIGREAYWENKKNYDYSVPVIVVVLLVSAILIVLTTYVVLNYILRIVHAQEESERNLQSRQKELQAVLDNTVDGIITINARGIMTSFNKASENIFGYRADECIGQNVKMLMPEPYRGEHDGYLHNYHTTHIPKIIGIGREVEAQRKDGSTFPMDLSVSKVHRNGQDIFIGLVRDITERKQMEQMKSEFVSTVSHELRTPLTAISGVLGLLVGGALGELPASAKPMIEIAHNNSRRLSHLINDLLDMEKIAAGKMVFDMKLHPLSDLLDQAIKGNQAYADQYQVHYELDTDGKEVFVNVDQQRFLQVMANLMSNAAKFAPAGSSVMIRTLMQGNKMRIEVQDQGAGIPEEFRGRIFQKFAQADSSDTRKKGGTGLGLAITKELVERMGGEIGFVSELNVGTTFYFKLPVIEVSDDISFLDMSEIDSGDLPILIIEDDDIIADIIALVLQRGGYKTQIALNGQHALELLRQSPFAAVTLDLMLPDLPGMEVIRQIRDDVGLKDLPIIVISAKIEAGKLEISGDFNHVEWLPKPLNSQLLFESIQRSIKDLETGEQKKVLHVEDDYDLYQVIKQMAGEQFSFTNKMDIASAEMAIKQQHFDIVILDVGLPDGSGLALVPFIRQHQPHARVIILSGTELSAEVASQVEGVLLKTQTDAKTLLEALNKKIKQHHAIKSASA